MSKVITARVDDETLGLVDSIAKAQGRSRAWFVADAVRRAAQYEADFRNFIQVGIDAADRGEVISQEEMERWLEDRIAGRQTTVIAAE
jgi:predicted transcriptional regulator